MNKKEFLEKKNLTENQFNGLEKIQGSLFLSSLTSIPKGFNPTIDGNLYLDNLKSIPEGFNPTVGGSLYFDSLKSIPEGFSPTVGGSLYLNRITSIPEGFSPIVGDTLYLNYLTSIPEGFSPTVGNNLYLNNVTSIPEGFNPTVGGSLFLHRLTSIPEGFNLTVGRGLYLNSLTLIPKGFNPTVGDGLDLCSLISIPEGFNPIVGGYLDLSSLISFPNNWNIDDYMNKKLPLISFQDGKYINVDGIFTEVLSKRGNVYKVKKLNGVKEFFVVGDGDGNFAHGNTIKEAKEDLIFKITNRSIEDFKDLSLKSVLSFKDAVGCYRVVTGACSFGTKDFVKTNNIEERNYSIKEIIKLTEGQFGNERFKNFFS